MVVKILIHAIHYPVSSGRYATEAFRRLGHSVYHIGQETGRNVWGIQVAEKYVWKAEPPPDDWQPDLCILMDTAYQWHHPTAPTVCWTVDNHVRDVRQPGINHYFLAHKNITQQPFEDDTTWLPCAFDQTIFTPSPIAWEDREYDVAIVGVMYPRRQALVNLLRARGYKVFAETGLLYEEYRNAYHNARISLCVSANGDVAQRIFETGAMGCLVLTDPLHDLVNVQTGETPDTNKALGLSGFSVYGSDLECLQQVERWIHEVPDVARAGVAKMQAACQQHTWDARAQVIINWVGKQTMTEAQPVVVEAPQVTAGKPYLNLGCGLTHFPSAPPAGHELVDAQVYAYPSWVNVDKVEGVGADKVFDLFTYPWPLEDNSFDGAVLAHIAEHIPHEIKVYEDRIAPPGVVKLGGQFYDENGARVVVKSDSERHEQLRKLQDGWFAFFSELYRVLTPGAKVYIVSPWGWSDGAITDPTHTRYLTVNSFLHALAPENNGGVSFRYETGCHFQMIGQPKYRITEFFHHLMPAAGDDADERERKQRELALMLATRLNVCYDFHVVLEAVK